MYNSANLAVKIKEVAKKKKIVIKDMLVACDIGSNTMSTLYHGKAIAYDSLAKIADYLDCSVDYLLERDKYVGTGIQVMSCEPDEPENRLLSYFSLLTDMEKGELLSDLKHQTRDRAEAEEEESGAATA